MYVVRETNTEITDVLWVSESPAELLGSHGKLRGWGRGKTEKGWGTDDASFALRIQVGSAVMFCSERCQAIRDLLMDTGTSLLTGPSGDIQHLQKAIGAEPKDGDVSTCLGWGGVGAGGLGLSWETGDV